MDPKYAQLHDGVEEASTELGVPVSLPAPLPSASTPTSVLGQINKEEITECTHVVVVSTEQYPRGDWDQTVAQEENNNDIEAKHGDLDSTGTNKQQPLITADADSTSPDFDAWIDLPHDVCRLILDLLRAFDTLSFPLVCSRWTDVYTEKRRLQPAGSGLQPGAPTLLTSASADCGSEISDDYLRRLFFINNILSGEVFPFEVEGMKCGRIWIGGKGEWLVTTSHGKCIQLLNPATGRCIALPDYFIQPSDHVQLCRTPTEDEGYFIIVVSFSKVSYTMAGCDHWIKLGNPDSYWLSFFDAIMHRGKIVAICRNRDLWSWDLHRGGGSPTLLLSSSINTEGWEQFCYMLAPSLKGNILIVTPYGERSRRGPIHRTHRNFFVDGAVLHEVDTDAQTMEEVRNIGDRALFLGPNYPFYSRVSFPMGDLKKNYLYIAALSDNDVVAIDLSMEDVPGNVTLIDYAGPPNSDQVPMWFRPAFP
uniref:Uncharacterized protein n=1 Tax=Avena sativa TaxID=4498 RepID=A0ACD5XA98_AVESA